MRGHNTERVTIEHVRPTPPPPSPPPSLSKHMPVLQSLIRTSARPSVIQALLSTKKSALKVGTESLSDLSQILFSDVEGFLLDRGLVLYPSDGGKFANIRWQNVRMSSFFPYTDESREGAVFDFESKHRSGLSQLSNITAEDILVSEVVGSSLLKGVAGAQIQGVTISNLSLTMRRPIIKNNAADLAGAADSRKPFVFECGHKHKLSNTSVAIDGLHIVWGGYKSEWAGLQSSSSCLVVT